MQVPARLQLLGLNHNSSKRDIAAAAARCGLTADRLATILHPLQRPYEAEITLLSSSLGVSEGHIRIVFGAIDAELHSRLIDNAAAILKILDAPDRKVIGSHAIVPKFQTELGSLYQGDCLDFLRSVESDSVDLVFADPPFNLRKQYESGIDDDLSEIDYLTWSEKWIDECCRVLKPGGSLFVWNIPKWCTHLSSLLNSRLNFRNWIAADIKYSLPISKRLYPSHYGLLYYIKGKSPSSFSPDRMPMMTCPSCGDEYKDYGGYKSKMNPLGINLGDVWTDISPVRHSKHKKRKDANELPIKLLDRIIEMATTEGQVVLDPFGGAGTTYAVCEIKGRRWLGAEIGAIDQIIDRLSDLEDERQRLTQLRSNYNHLFPPAVRTLRIEKGLWTCESFDQDEQRTTDDVPPTFELVP